MAKPFSEVVNIQPQTISTGQPQALMSLSQRLDDFSAQAAGVAAEHTIQKATVQGQEAAAQLQPGDKPEFKKQSFVGGIAKSAYNKALRSSYVAGVDTDLTMQLSALKTEHSTDLTTFNDSANAIIKGTIECVDPASRQMIMESASNFMDSARIDVQKATIEREMGEADDGLILSGEFYTDEADFHAFKGDNLASDEALVKVFNINQSRVESLKISPAQAAILNDDARQSVRVSKNRGEFNKVLNSENGIRKAAKGLELLASNQLPGMDVDQHDELLSTLSSDLSQFITMQNRQEVADEGTLKAVQARTATNFAVDMSVGLLTQDQLNRAARKGNLSSSQYDKLTTKLSSQGIGVTDISLQLDLQTSIIGGLDMRSEIVNNMGVHLTMADAGALLTMQEEYSSEESVLNSNYTNRARSFLTESTKITGLLGRLTSDGSRKTAEAIRTFDSRVLAGEDPFAVADDLYGHDSLIKVQKKLDRRNIDTDNVPEAIKQLTADFRLAWNAAKGERQQSDLKSNYNRDLSDLNNLRDLQTSQKQFANALKGAQL